MASNAEYRVVNLAGLVQGITLVTFPAASTILTDPSEYDLSNSQYGFMFIPQVLTAIATSLLGSRLASRFSAKAVLIVGLASNIASMVLLVMTTAFESDQAVAYPLLLLATAFLGTGFGLTVPVLNTYVAEFRRGHADRAVLVLNALLGLGTALAPVFVAVFVGLGFWWGLPVLSTVLLILLALSASRLPLRAEPARGEHRAGGHPAALLAVRGFRRSLRDLRDHERQLVGAGDDLGAGRVDHPGRARADGVLGDGHRSAGSCSQPSTAGSRGGWCSASCPWSWWRRSS